MASPQRRGAVALIAALIVAAILRIVHANYSLAFDDFASLFFASQPLDRLWSAWMVRETNPPLFYTVLRAWVSVPIPIDSFWLRIPPIVASLLAIPATYFGVNRAYGPKAAGVAALLLAVSAQQIFYAQQVRCYSSLFLALVISLFGIVRIAMSLEQEDRVPAGAWAAYVGGAIVAVYLHTTAIFWPIIATLSLIAVVPALRPIVGRLWLHLVVADVVILACSGWWIYITYLQVSAPNSNIGWLQYKGLGLSLVEFWRATLLLREPEGWQKILKPVLCALAVFGVLRTRRSVATRLLAVCWLVAIVVYILISLKQSILVERTIVWIAIFPAILIAAGIGTIKTPWRFVGMGVLAVTPIAANLALSKSFELENWQGAVRRVAHDPVGAVMVHGEGDGVVLVEACKVALHRPTCPFPIVTLRNRSSNAWAFHLARPVPASSQGMLALPARTNLYFVQRWAEQPLQALHAAGLAKSAVASGAFFVGPFAQIIPHLQAHSRVQDGVLLLSKRPLANAAP